MDIKEINQIFTDHLFKSNSNRNVFQAGIGKTLSSSVKKIEVLKHFHQHIFPHSDKSSHNTPTSQRDVNIIHVLPTLARHPHFIELMCSHAQKFCETFMERANSSEIQSALLKKNPIKTFEDAGKFFDIVLEKYENNKPVTDNEKIVFKLLLTGMFKMDHSLDTANSFCILWELSKYFHPDKCDLKGDLYPCILSKGPRLAKAISGLWDVEIKEKSDSDSFGCSDDHLIESIAKLNKLEPAAQHWARQKIRKELLTTKTLDQQDIYKENLLKAIIQNSESGLLKILMNRVDFDINQMKINGETPLIYALELRADHRRELVIRILMGNENFINTHNLKGKTPLQIAIDRHVKCRPAWLLDSHINIINILLDSPKLSVDGKDSDGLTALCHITLFPKIDSQYLDFIKKLINLGANIDQPIPSLGTVRTLLGKKLNPDQFADMEILADNQADIRRGIEFHGDEIVRLIHRYKHNTTGHGRISMEITKAIVNSKTLLQNKSVKKTVLMAAIESNNVTFVELLLKRSDFTVNQLTPDGDTPLSYANKIGASDDIVRILSENLNP